jgi:hypothetical protein
MQINADALACGFDYYIAQSKLTLSSSLQIFENESHASVHTDKTKEGLSLYGRDYITYFRNDPANPIPTFLQVF